MTLYKLTISNKQTDKQEITKSTAHQTRTSCAGSRAICSRPVRSTLQPSTMNIHDRQAAARSGRWRRLWCRPYKLFTSTANQSGLVTLTLKVVSESSVTWATPVPILVFLGLSVLELRPMYATDRQTSDVGQSID